MRVRAWEATGSLVTADGSEDDKILPQGLNNWPGLHPPGFAIRQEWLGESSGEEDGEVEEGEDEEHEPWDSDAEYGL